MTPETVLRHALVRLPLRARRRLLRALWIAGRATGRLPNYELQQTLTSVLRVSRVEAVRIEREIVYQDWIATAEWAVALHRSPDGIRADCEAIRVENPEVLQRLGALGEPVMLMPLHMGCFVLPFLRVMHDHFPGRRMLILRAREDRPEDTEAMRRIAAIGVDMRFLNVHDKQGYFDAVRFARDGAVIVCFGDLPASYGGAVSLNLFSTPVRLALGVEALARIARANVVPMAVQSDIGGDTVRVGRAFQVVERDGAEKQRFVDNIRRHIEDSIRRAPEQWHMLGRFDEYRVHELQNEAA